MNEAARGAAEGVQFAKALLVKRYNQDVKCYSVLKTLPVKRYNQRNSPKYICSPFNKCNSSVQLPICLVITLKNLGHMEQCEVMNFFSRNEWVINRVNYL